MRQATSLFLIGLAVLLPTDRTAHAQVSIRTLAGPIDGHEVGGLAVDMIGNLYAGDFGDIVWRITPEGERREFASGMYGTAGNAIDGEGQLLQASFYADTVTRIDRTGRTSTLVHGLSRPAGIAIHRQTREIYVTNCASNSVARISTGAAVSPFATSELFNCPYGASFDREGNLFVVNFNDNRMLKVDPRGAVSLFATVSAKGLGHLCFKGDRFYVTAFRSHAIYEVRLDKTVTRILGNGEQGTVDGTDAEARLSHPMGIACHPWAPRLYVNEDVNEGRLPRRSLVRVITLESEK